MPDPKIPSPARDSNSPETEPHDVLAAEAFAVPAPDPTLADAEAHDVLAAEEFAVPAADPTIHHPPVVLPSDLTGTAEASEVLAAEEFAMPAPPGGGAVVPARASYETWLRRVVLGLAAWFAARLLARTLSRR